jgi:hypothetical protein
MNSTLSLLAFLLVVVVGGAAVPPSVRVLVEPRASGLVLSADRRFLSGVRSGASVFVQVTASAPLCDATTEACHALHVIRSDHCWMARSAASMANLTSCGDRTSGRAPAPWRLVESVRVNATLVDLFHFRADADVDRPLELPSRDNDAAAVLVDADAIFARGETRELTHTGFHGVLATKVLAGAACRAMLVELLPRGVFVDVYQVRGLEAFDPRRARALVADTVDLEVPTYSPLARDVAVRLFADTADAAFELPVHGRYQRPQEHDAFTTVTIGAPLLFVQCDEDGGAWRLVHTRSLPIEWRLPNGLLGHLALVTWGTISTTVLGALAVVASVAIAQK